MGKHRGGYKKWNHFAAMCRSIHELCENSCICMIICQSFQKTDDDDDDDDDGGGGEL